MNEQNNFQNQNGLQHQNVVTPKSEGKGFSIAALVLGIVGVVFGWFGVFGFVALVASIVGIVLAVIGRKRSIAVHGKPSGMATAGLVLSIIGTCLAGIAVVACTACAACVGGTAAGIESLF